MESEKSDFRGTLLGSSSHPIVNPALVIRNWGHGDVELWVDNRKMEKGQEYRVGHHRNQEGTDLIVWLEYTGRTEMEIRVRRCSE